MYSEYIVPILSCVVEQYCKECSYMQAEKARIEAKGCDCIILVGIDLSYKNRESVFLCRKPDENDRKIAKYWGKTVEQLYAPFANILKTCKKINT